MKLIKPGEEITESRIYKCSKCSALKAFIKGDIATHCDYCIDKGSWKPTRKEILIRTKNVKKTFEKQLTLSERISQKITSFCGSMKFIYIHAVWFSLWLTYNSISLNSFDPPPFGLLTLIVSLEAILLATFILIAQNRQGEISEIRSELDYQVDLNSEKRIAEMQSLLQELNNRLKKR